MRARTLAVVAALVGVAVCLPGGDAGAKKSESRAERAAASARARLAPTLKKRGLAFGDDVYLRIFKEEAELEVWLRGRGEKKFERLKTYDICAYSGELGPKQKVGDEQAPEGFYAVGPSAMNPASSYHLSFNLGYPNAFDKAHGRTGSLIMVHGDCVSVGCFAMTDDGIEEIYSLADAALSNGQKFFRVHAFPFRMTKANMKRHAGSTWIGFWKNLKEGYDLFEAHRVPPEVNVKDKRYVFVAPQ